MGYEAAEWLVFPSLTGTQTRSAPPAALRSNARARRCYAVAYVSLNA